MDSKRFCNERRETTKEEPVGQSRESRDEEQIMRILDGKCEKLSGEEYEGGEGEAP
jgi:hypothetical protein